MFGTFGGNLRIFRLYLGALRLNLDGLRGAADFEVDVDPERVPAASMTPLTTPFLKPSLETSTRYSPGPRSAALYSPVEEVTTWVAALVAVFTTVTGAFATAALEGSSTDPVMLPSIGLRVAEREAGQKSQREF